MNNATKLTPIRKYTTNLHGYMVPALRWVNRATNPSDSRLFLRQIHIMPGAVLVGSDGGCAHAVWVEGDLAEGLPEEGAYHMVYQGPNRVDLFPANNADPRYQMPPMIMDLLKPGEDWKKIDWCKKTPETCPADLYQLICALGTKDPKGKPQAWNPDYLVDALKMTGHNIMVGDKRLVMQSNPEEEGPTYRAVVMGLRVE